MQLIALGGNIINLDNISVLDIDRTQNQNFVVVRVHSDSNQSIIDITIPIQVLTPLMNMVPQHLRFGGDDDPNT
jgi:hypothetical protein